MVLKFVLCSRFPGLWFASFLWFTSFLWFCGLDRWRVIGYLDWIESSQKTVIYQFSNKTDQARIHYGRVIVTHGGQQFTWELQYTHRSRQHKKTAKKCEIQVLTSDLSVSRIRKFSQFFLIFSRFSFCFLLVFLLYSLAFLLVFWPVVRKFPVVHKFPFVSLT